MVMGVDMIAGGGQRFGEAGVAGGVFGEAVIDLDNAARLGGGGLVIEAERRAGGGMQCC